MQNFTNDYRKLSQEQEKLSEKQKTPTYLTSSTKVTPTKTDISTAISARATKQKESDLIKNVQTERWYDDISKKKVDPEAKQEGLIMRALNFLNKGLYASVGVAETLTGEGTEEGLFANIASNIEERETYGDLLRKKGVSKAVSIPAGFALDVAMDPLNWATMGTGALVPRIALGATRGLKTGKLLEGISSGVKSGLAKKAATTLKYTPIARRTEFAAKVAKYAVEENDWYNKVTGVWKGSREATALAQKTKLSLLSDKILTSAGSAFKNTTAGKKIAEGLGYFPNKWSKELHRLEENVMPTEEAALAELKRQSADTDAFDIAVGAKGPEDNRIVLGIDLKKGLDIAADSTGAFGAKEAGSRIVGPRITEEALKDENKRLIFERVKELSEIKTGVKWWDDFMAWTGGQRLSQMRVKKALEMYTEGINIFKIAKVPLSPGAYVNAAVGNAIFVKMAGINLTPEFWGEVGGANGFLRGTRTSEKFLQGITSNPIITQWLNKHPAGFVQAFSVHPDLFLKRADLTAKMNKMIKSGAEKKKIEELFLNGQKDLDELTRPLTAAKRIHPESATGEALMSGGLRPEDLVNTYSAEFVQAYAGVHQRTLKKLEELANSPDSSAAMRAFAKFSESYLTKPMQMYERIDQSYKLGIFSHLMNNGITENELRTLKDVINISDGDIRAVESVDKFLFSNPQKAAEVAQEIFMNYGQMPAWVKLARVLPFFGSPFASFMHAMVAKTGKTLMYNPAFFNKVAFALQEMPGGLDPLERETLRTSPYYQFLNQPGMVKIPFIEDNPIFVNLANMIPYYTINAFQPAERNMETFMGKATTELVDKNPYFGKTPEGQIMFNYFILPMLLREEDPQGIFGQRLYPKDATPAQKYAYYPLRDLAEAPMPQIIGPLGIIAGLAGEKPARMPGETIVRSLPIPGVGSEEYFPSFRYRQFARATRGQTVYGKPAAESKLSRLFRTIMSLGGVPIHPMPIQPEALSDQVK